MKKIFSKLKCNILIYDLIFVGFNILVNFSLYLLNMRFRTWIIILIILVSIIGFIVGIVQQLCNFYKNKKIVILISVLIAILIGLLITIFMPIISFVAIFSYQPEHIVNLDNKKYVAIVSSFLHVDVDYYGPLLMGTKVRVHGYFGKGGFDPFIEPNIARDVEYTYYDNNGVINHKKNVTFIKDEDGNIIDNTSYDIDINDSNKYNGNDKYLLPEDEEVLYEKKFGKTILRFTRVGHTLGQRSIVRVLRSKDSGKNFYVVSDDVIQVSNEAKFIFLNEDLGFAISNGKVYLSSDSVPGLYVTNDSGKTFEGANFKYENVEYINIEDFPYYDKDILKIKCLVYQINPDKGGYENKELIFTSNDNGLTWILQ